jgi:hypothetical protein
MNCQHCGANLALDDMTRPNCPYCGHVLKHHAQAAEHAVLVNKILQQQIGAQYPGMPQNQIPQIGYQYGAPMHPSFGQFQHDQISQAVHRAKWITIVAIVVPLVIVLLALAGVAVAMLLF